MAEEKKKGRGKMFTDFEFGLLGSKKKRKKKTKEERETRKESGRSKAKGDKKKKRGGSGGILDRMRERDERRSK